MQGLWEAEEQFALQQGTGGLIFISAKNDIIVIKSVGNWLEFGALEGGSRSDANLISKYLAWLAVPPLVRKLRGMAAQQQKIRGWTGLVRRETGAINHRGCESEKESWERELESKTRVLKLEEDKKRESINQAAKCQPFSHLVVHHEKKMLI